MEAQRAKVDHQQTKEVAVRKRLDSLKSGFFDDVKLVLDDGDIGANKINLCLHSDYFQEIFKSNNFADGEVKVECKKYFMEKVLEYLYEGQIDFNNFDFLELMELLRLSKMMKLELLFKEIKNFAFDTLVNIKVVEKLQALVYAEDNNLLGDVDFILDHLDSPQNLELARETEEFKKLSLYLVKSLLKRNAPDIDRLRALHEWYQASPEEIKRDHIDDVIGTFDIKKFTGDDLIGIVSESAFFYYEDVLMMLGKIIADNSTQNANLQASNEEKEKVIAGMSEKIDTLTKSLELLTSRVTTMEDNYDQLKKGQSPKRNHS